MTWEKDSFVRSIGTEKHTCHKLWTKICEIRQNFKGDTTKFCEIFLNITLELPQYSLKSFFFFLCDLCLFLHNICCKMETELFMGIAFQIGQIV